MLRPPLKGFREMSNSADSASKEPAAPATKPKLKRRRLLRFFFYLLVLLVVAGVCARPFLPGAIRWYVNRTLDRSELYQGKIGDVEVNLWRGAYAIDDVRLVKMTGSVPVPLFAAKRVEFAIQWNALLHRRVVGQVVVQEPELNFVDAPTDGDSQTGEGGPWLQMIRDLSPFEINRAEVHEGSVHFRTYTSAQPVDVFLSHLEASIDDLSNINRESTPLVTTVEAKALAMDQAKFEYKMKLDPLSYRPTFHFTARLLGLDVTKINDMARTYGKFDFKRGWFDVVIEVDAKEGQLTGYVKPLFRNLVVFSLIKDLKQDDPLQFFWTAVVGVTTRILSNQSRDQFGTLVPFKGDASISKPDILATIGNILRNAFIRAYLPRIEGGSSSDSGLQFEPPTLEGPVSVGDKPG